MNQNPVDASSPAAYESSEAKPMMTLQTLPPAVSFPPALYPAIWPGLGVKNEVKPAQFKQGIVNVAECRTLKKGLSYFELRYVDIDTGKEVRRRVSGLDLDEIKVMAENLTRKAYQGKGYLAGQKSPDLESGILEAIQLSRGNDATKADTIERARPFLAFMAGRYPGARTWGDVRPGMVENYIRHCESECGLAYDSIRLRLVPIKAAWRRMHQDYPELVRPLPKLKLAAPARREIDCLDADELAALLGWLKAHRPALYPMACLQGLAGLRMMEAAALRRQDVDLEAGTVTITKTPYHTPKNQASYRVIPITGDALAVLKAAVAGQKIRPTSGELFTNADGGLWIAKPLSLIHRWMAVLKRAALDLYPADPETGELGKETAAERERFLSIPAHRLRAAFATLAGRLGAQDRLVKACMGHAAGDVLGNHYRKIELDELRTVSSLMTGWREAAKSGDFRKETGNIRPAAFANN